MDGKFNCTKLVILNNLSISFASFCEIFFMNRFVIVCLILGGTRNGRGIIVSGSIKE